MIVLKFLLLATVILLGIGLLAYAADHYDDGGED